MHDIVVVGCIFAFILSFMFSFTLKLWWRLFVISLYIMKYGLVVLFVIAITCMPQTYSYFGYTPVSILLGNQVYDESLRVLKLPDPHPRPTSDQKPPQKNATRIRNRKP